MFGMDRVGVLQYIFNGTYLDPVPRFPGRDRFVCLLDDFHV